MNENNLIKMIIEFKKFKEDLIHDIQKKIIPKLMNYKECILIEEDWYNEFHKIIVQYKNKKNSYKRDEKLHQFLSKKIPKFVNDIKSAINYLNKLSKLKLVSNNMIKLAYSDSNNLNNINRVHYYAGNNKLIIEYKEIKENDALLFINPLEVLSNQEIFIFKIKNQNPDKRNFYRELLSKGEIDLNYFKENKNIIIECKKFNDENNNSSHFEKISKHINNSRQYNQNNNNTNNLDKFINSSQKNKFKNNYSQKNENFDKKKNNRKFSSFIRTAESELYEKYHREKNKKKKE